MKRILLIFLLLTSVLLHASEPDDYGLYVKSYKNLGKDRTSLLLDGGEPMKIRDEMTLSFDMLIRNENIFGNVVKIVGDTNEAIGLIFSADERDNRFPSLILHNQFYPISNTVEWNAWFTVKIKLSTKKDSIFLSYKNIQKSYPFSLKNWNNVRISFGTCPFVGFQTSESAPVNIRNVRVFDREKLTRHWVLKQHSENICYDSVRNVVAEAINPLWLIDRHIEWKKIYSKEFEKDNNPQYAYDVKRDRLYLVPNEKEIIEYDLVTGRDTIISVRGGYPAAISTNSLIYNHLTDKLVSYSLDEQTVSRFSFAEKTWSKRTPCEVETAYWHHTASINDQDSTLVAFGGYGYYTYKNELFKLDLGKDSWSHDKLLTVTPRYSSASTVVDNKLYIFGGRGSECGKQDVNTHYYHDFYSVDLATNEITLLWEANMNADFLPCGNMVYNPSDSCFYALSNIANGTLIRFNKSTPEITKVSIGINEVLDADFSFYTLFYSPNLKKIFALFSNNYKNGNSKVVFYEIAYPPLSRSEILQAEPVMIDKSLWIFAGVALVIVSVTFFFYKNKQERKSKKEEENIKKVPSKAVLPQQKDNQHNVYGYIKIQEQKFFDRSHACINLLGGFNVMDRNGENITPSFTPILKNLLLLILLYTDVEDKGINDKKIDEILWSDKDRKSARNNRNVSLSRLRVLLENIGDISLINTGGFWKIDFGNSVFCDYLVVMKLMREANSNRVDENTTSKLLELLMCGPLLPHTHVDWVDKFKGNYSSEAIDLFYKMLSSDQIAEDEELAIQLADTIFLFDSLNEEALNIKCSILYNSGKKSLAKKSYDIFVKEYKLLLGEDYKYSLAQVLEKTKDSESFLRF